MIYKHGKHEIELFDSIHNLPILRFQRFNKYQMISFEIGNTFEDYDKRTQKIIQFLKKGMTTEALQELENRRQSVFNAFNEFTPTGKAFAVLVKRIDGVNYETFSPDDLDRCLEHLERIGLGNKDSIEKLIEIKKKIETELAVYFPNYFSKNGNKEQTVLRFKRMNALLDSVIEMNFDEDNEKLFKIEKDILETDKPNVWNVWIQGNMERSLEVDFRKFAISVTEKTGQNIENLSTFTFYSSVEFLTDQNKPKK